jgi:NAD(P)-dependent dehydrogenase (short-subunit alcohol dehydrogenase family)
MAHREFACIILSKRSSFLRPSGQTKSQGVTMSLGNTERIVLITGSNRGIGLETARQLARRGWHVILAARDAAKGQQTLEAIQADGAKATFLSLDVNSSDGIRTAVGQFAALADHLDVLINNAAIYPDQGLTILTLPRDRLDQTFQTNVFGPLEIAQGFLPFLRRANAARIINVSSGYGQLDGLSANVPSYCLSKLALNGLTIMLAEALQGDHIAVNSMCPGWVRTEMGGPNATRSVEEGAETAVWLADEAPHELTGKFFRNRREIPW